MAFFKFRKGGGEAATLTVGQASLSIVPNGGTFEIDDTAAEIDLADASILNGATAITATGTAGIDDINLSDNINNPVTVGVTVDLLDGADIFVGGFGNDVITGGTGADTLTGDAGRDTFTFASGDSASFAFTDGGVVGTIGLGDKFIGNFDVITDFATEATAGVGLGDKLNLEGILDFGSAAYVNGLPDVFANLAAGDVYLVKGNYSNLTDIFSVNDAGTSTLVI